MIINQFNVDRQKILNKELMKWRATQTEQEWPECTQSTSTTEGN